MNVRHSLLGIFALTLVRLRAHRRAGIAVMVGLSLPFLIGAAGFATDSAFWFAQHTALQSAADAAAVAAARDLETNPGVAQTTLESDAVTAANAASSNQFGLTSAGLTVSALANDPRQVEADAAAPAKLFFSPFAKMGNFNIHTRAVAGVAYSLISTQAACQALDSFTYIYSTGFGTLETAHSSGIDPYTCGQQAMVPPLPYNAYCNGGVLSCTLEPITNTLGVNVGGSLLPVAFQVEPNGNGGGTMPALSSVLATIPSLLGAATSTSTGTPASFQQGSASCPANVCTITAGVYPGGIIIGPGVTFNFAANGSGLGSNYFLLLNGNLVISTQALLGSGSNNFMFFMLGATPGGYVAETQVQVNLAPVSQGALTYTSTAALHYSSVLGTQISAPLSSMPYAEQQAATPSMGLLGAAGLPGGNLVGANYESVVSVCTQATTLCATPLDVQGPQYQTALTPSLNSVSSALAVQNLVAALGSTPLTSAASDLLTSSGEASSTSFTSALAIANGIPTDWVQTETQTGTLSNNTPALATVLSSIGNLLGSILNILFPSAVTLNVETVYSYLTAGGGSLSNPASSNASGVFAGQISSGTNATGCSNGTVNLYAGTPTISPGFGPVFTNLLNSSNTANGQTLALTTTDSIAICGTESRAVSIAQIFPGQSMTGATAAGASTLALLK